MSFAVDLNARPAPIEVKFAGGEFQLEHTYMDADERSRAVEALARGGLAASGSLLFEKIVNWVGVTNPEGVPLPLFMVNRDNVKSSNLSKVFGRLPWVTQIQTIVKLFAANGVRFGTLRDALEPFTKDAQQLDALVEEMEDFFNKADASPAASSTESPTPATSPPRSA